jgi:hypothetical protein
MPATMPPSPLVLDALRALAFLVIPLSTATAQEQDFENAPILYYDVEAAGPVAELRSRLESGELSFKPGNDKELLRQVLHELKVPTDSQVLVFSKTSKQNERIHPATPRAIYFSDDLYVGWVPGGMIELGSVDPDLGAVFHLMDHREREAVPRFERPEDCLTCHASSRTGNAPGFLVRSVYPDENGFPLLSEGSYVTTHDSPLDERWGGWYVTGSHGEDRHMGNVIAHEIDEGTVVLDREPGANLDSLDHLFNTDPYLAKTSDILALMVLEHQTEMHNRLNRASTAFRIATYRQAQMKKLFGEKPSRKLEGTVLSITESHVRKILQYMLFAEELPIDDGNIDSDGPFRDAFLANRRESSEGRSLKDFQLLDRLFKYRCSYMIYSSSFETLPTPLKNHLYQRLWTILKGEDPEFQHLGESESTRIKSILLETKTDLPPYWKPDKPVATR